MSCPSLIFGQLRDPRYRFDSYWNTLEELDVPTPTTKVIELNESEAEYPDCPSDAIYEFMVEHELNQAFIKSGYKAAIDRFREGSIISAREKPEIESTFNSLMTQHIRNDISHGNTLVVREKLDLSYCLAENHAHAYEKRYFFEDGEILSETPRFNPFNPVPDCPMQYSYIEDRLEDMREPIDIGREVAEAFQDTGHPLSVDVVLDAFGKWWVIEVHLNGVYYNERDDDWWNMCGHADNEVWGPKWMHSSALRVAKNHRK